MNDRGRQMARSGSRIRNPSAKAKESAESEEKMEKGKIEINENKKRSKKGKSETEEIINFKEESSEDVFKSQPINIDPNDDSTLLDDTDDDEGEEGEEIKEEKKEEEGKKNGKCSLCGVNKSDLDCDSCEKDYCFTCEAKPSDFQGNLLG